MGSAAPSPEQDESVGVNSRCELGERLTPTGLSTSQFQVCLGTTLETMWGGRKQGSSQKTQPAPPHLLSANSHLTSLGLWRKASVSIWARCRRTLSTGSAPTYEPVRPFQSSFLDLSWGSKEGSEEEKGRSFHYRRTGLPAHCLLCNVGQVAYY